MCPTIALKKFARFAICAWSFVLVGGRTSHADLQGFAWVDGHGHIDIHYKPVDPMVPNGPKHFDLHWHIGEGLGSTVIGLPPVFSQDFESEELYPVVPLVSNSNFLRPAGSQWNFTGAAAGGQLYVIPLEVPPQNEVLPRLGLASDLEFAEWVGGTYHLTFSLLNGPGHFSIFDGDAVTPVPLYSSFGGTPASFTQIPSAHYHHNYAFTSPGVYEFELGISGNHVIDGQVSGLNTFRIFVGEVAVPEPSSWGLLTFGWLASVRARRRR